MPHGNAIRRRSFLWGTSGALLLLAVYFLTLTLSNALSHALEELRVYGVWIGLLTVGFGLQVGLFAYVRASLKKRGAARAAASMAASGGASATAMVACCLHHLTDILPILGLGAASLFLVRYQTFFLAVGVGSNLVGVTLMLRLIQKHDLYEPGHGILGRILRWNMDRALAISTVLGIALPAVTLLGSL